MKKKFVRRIFGAAVFLGFLFAAVQLMTTADATQSDQLTVKQENGKSILGTSSLGDFHRTERTISDTKIIQLPESNGKAIIWQEQGVGRKIPFYALSTDGKNVSRVQETSYDLMLRYASFDPLVSAPETPSALSAKTDGGENTYIVQFVTQPLEEYRAAIKNLGGKNYIYLPNHAQLVKMDAATKANVEALPFVRWVGHYQPAYKLEEFLLDSLSRNSLQPARYNVMVLERGKTMQDELAANIRALGGKVDLTIPEGFRMEVTLSPDQLVAVANDSDVLFIDRWSAPEADMEIVRATGGANFIEDTLGFKGEGVRAEVMDGGLLVTHTDFQSGNAPIVHGTINVDSHGTATYGINFGRGTTNPAARGMLPEAQGIIAGYPQLTNRYTHTARLKQDPYKAVYQSNSWGSTLTTAYNTISAEMDDILFKEDFVLLNSQSNAGTQQSRPQAWAKNVVSIGGVRHYNTASFDDDRWSNGASIGPAADGRIKPDLAHFYDSVHTTTSTSTTAYTTTFGGTSAATPITAGHFGIFFQMWHNGLFGNPTGATVFDSRPHMTTVKAVMINTAIQWNMTGTDLTRVRQGFGRANLQNLYNLRNKMMIVDESHVLTNTQSRSYTIKVAQGSTDPLKVTMVYADPMGSPSATRARINDLTLKVTAPDGSVYWGNNGLGVGGGMWSTPGGSANVIDTVENVFIQNPEAGNWNVEVIASEINQDARIETPNVVDADYSLVASGIVAQRKAAFDYDGDGKSDVSVFRPSNSTWYLNRSTSGFTAQQFGVSTDRLAPADYDGDGRTDVAVFRVNGNLATFYISNSSNNAFRSEQFGAAGDIPVSGDFDGDGRADVAVYRNGGSAGAQSYFFYRPSGTPGVDFRTIAWGTNGDRPVMGDFDGDSKQDAAVFRPSNGIWYVLKSGDNQLQAVNFGNSTDKLVPADYDGDAKTDFAVFRNGTWYIQGSQAGFTASQFGISSDVPVPADYDGDGKADIAVFRNGVWYQSNSTSGFNAVTFGQGADLATQTAYLP